MAAVDYGRDALDFIESLNRHTTITGVMDAVERAFHRFGFETIIVAGLPAHSSPDFSSHVMARLLCINRPGWGFGQALRG